MLTVTVNGQTYTIKCDDPCRHHVHDISAITLAMPDDTAVFSLFSGK